MSRKNKEKHRYTSIGGQALMEGIMMRGPEKSVMCVRRLNGTIHTEEVANVQPTKVNKIPVVRGVVSFIQAMSQGTKMLMRSAEIAIEDEMAAAEEEEKKKVESAEAIDEAPAEAAEAAGEAAEVAEDVEAVEETAAEVAEDVEAVEETAAEVAEETEAVEETAAEVAEEAEAVEETAAEVAEEAEAVEETAAEVAEEAAPAESIAAAAAEKADKTEKAEKIRAAVEKESEAPAKSTGKKILTGIGCVLCLALAAFLFFYVSPIAVTALQNSVFPSILPQKALDVMNADPSKWTMIVSAAVKVIFLLVVFGLISLVTGPSEKQKAKRQAKKDAKNANGSDGIESGFLVFISTILGFGLAILLFFYAPTWGASALFKWVFPNVLSDRAASYMATQAAQNIWRPIIEGIIKIIILITYMALCSTMKEIHTLFQYHGAEHKTIFCYEAGEELTVENVRKYKRFHPRCGTSFIILMLLVGIVAGMAIKYLLPSEIANSNIYYPLIKLALIPLIMGVGYELLKFCGRHDNIITKIIAAPGLWMQRITTKEPTDAMIECAIAAIKPVIPENGEDMQ